MRRMIGRRKIAFIAIMLASIMIVSYVSLLYFPQHNQNVAYATSDEKASSVNTTLVSANTQFAITLFRELVAKEEKINLFISPWSITTALTMIYNGAEGTTRDAMEETLNFGNMSVEEINQEYATLRESLETVDQAVTITRGNSVWMKNEFEPLVHSSFLERIQTSYKGEIFSRDFTDAQTISEINSWVDQRTEGKIHELVQQLDPELVMLLINAIYFKGAWVTQFDETETHRHDFVLPEGNTIQVDMMVTSGNFSYYSGQTCQVVRLPYGRDKIAMYVFLPNKRVSLDVFITNLTHTTHEEYIKTVQPVRDLVVNLPKFKVEYGVKRLNSVLKQLGMGSAFHPSEANFNGIASTSPENLYISYVDHKAVVEVNEEGTEASAATSVGIGLTSLPPSFTINRPFFFEIRDDRSGTILFMGTIRDPTQT